MDPSEILSRTAHRWGVTASQLRGTSRRRPLPLARHAAMWALRRRGLPLLDIAGELRRDHATVIYGIRRVERLRRVDSQLAAALGEILDTPAAHLDRSDPTIDSWLRECGV